MPLIPSNNQQIQKASEDDLFEFEKSVFEGSSLSKIHKYLK